MGISVLFVLLVLIDRYYWAQVSQWREDQATNIWLGYTSKLSNIPVGLMSSKGIPNPNGMVLLGFLLSALPSLLFISLFLGFLQITFILLVGWKSCAKSLRYFLLVAAPGLASVVLGSASVEYWNQYTITLVNILFIFWAMWYLQRPRAWKIPTVVVLIVTAPSLYLAGIANAMVMSILTTAILIYKRPGTRNILFVVMVSLLIILLSVGLTWLPYFQNVNFEQLRSYNKQQLGVAASAKIFWESFVGIPSYLSLHWSLKSVFRTTFFHADDRIISSASQKFLGFVGFGFLIQTIFAYSAFLSIGLRWLTNRLSGKASGMKVHVPALRLVVLSTLFLGLSYAISALLGGPDWLHGERLDQTVQFLPLLLYLIFLLPVAILPGGAFQKIIGRISLALLSFFTVVNLVGGSLLIHDHLQYRGNILTVADVPLRDKMQVIAFIASDWKRISDSKTIPVDYELGGAVWDFIPEFGRGLLPWYPAPMTLGRSFDYEFLRQYGFTNHQEGIQIRTCDRGRYIIAYAFEDPALHLNHGPITYHYFGRLKVYVIEK